MKYAEAKLRYLSEIQSATIASTMADADLQRSEIQSGHPVGDRATGGIVANPEALLGWMLVVAASAWAVLS